MRREIIETAIAGALAAVLSNYILRMIREARR